MGQVVTSAEMRRVVDANLQSYIEQGTQHYARLFGKSPTFVTYYAQDPDASMVDVNLGGAIQLVGPESPIRYQVIHDFPIYGVSEADVSSAYEELQGIVSSNIRGEAYCLPGTIEPNENDFFVIDHLKTKLVFRALTTNPDRIEGRSFFKIEYALDPSDPLALARQVDKSFTFELSTVGTGGNPLIGDARATPHTPNRTTNASASLLSICFPQTEHKYQSRAKCRCCLPKHPATLVCGRGRRLGAVRR